MRYIPPTISTVSGAEIVERIGPATASTSGVAIASPSIGPAGADGERFDRAR